MHKICAVFLCSSPGIQRVCSWYAFPAACPYVVVCPLLFELRHISCQSVWWSGTVLISSALLSLAQATLLSISKCSVCCPVSCQGGFSCQYPPSVLSCNQIRVLFCMAVVSVNLSVLLVRVIVLGSQDFSTLSTQIVLDCQDFSTLSTHQKKCTR